MNDDNELRTVIADLMDEHRHCCLRSKTADMTDLILAAIRLHLGDALDEAVGDAAEEFLDQHDDHPSSSGMCRCGARDNMDGDLLHSHRVGVLAALVRARVEELFR